MSETAGHIEECCPARAALAGNPSDGFGGAVVSIPVRSRHAHITIRPDVGYRFRGVDDEIEVVSWNQVLELARGATPESPHALVLAAAATFGDLPGFAIEVSTTVPRSVGLAGSSAIVIAALRAFQQHADLPLLHPDVLASTALAVEVDGLRISAGLQDRVVQVYDHPVLMRFDSASMREVDGYEIGTYRRITAGAPLRLFVAAMPSASEPSQVVHGDLRRRYVGGDRRIAASMIELARLAEDAAEALASGSVADLGAAMDATFDLRRTIVDVAPQLVTMIDTARSAGASANSAGSGGSIVVLAPDADFESRARQSLTELGCELIEV